MSSLVVLRGVSKSFGLRPLLVNVSLGLAEGERVGVVGANGCGKSTLLQILAGILSPDAGERAARKGLRAAYLAQEDDIPAGLSVEEVAAEPLRALGVPAAQRHARVGEMLGRAGLFDPDQSADDLSGGGRKRLALVRELVKEPDLLLLDEPTNHLDLESILWLESFLPQLPCAWVAVSHDRYFLENAVTRILEPSPAAPDGILDVDGAYEAYLVRREEALRGLKGLEQSLASKVRREIEWLRRGPKARTTKAKFRKDEAARLMGDLAEVKSLTAERASAGIEFADLGRKTKRLLTAEGLALSLGGRPLFKDLDLVLSPGTRLGLAGPNGSGKTSLLRVLSGELAPDAGAVSRAPALQIAVFDQTRDQLNRSETLRQALAPDGGDAVIFQGRPLHIVTWAKRFLFPAERLDTPVALLSGGEQARALIARLMLTPADALFLDEPTNDLDIPTLEILEESLLDFPGAVVLITHDRFLMDRAATAVVGLDGLGGAAVYADQAQFEEVRRQAAAARSAPASKKAARPVEPAGGAPARPRKLSYKDQLEYDGMEAAILAAEAALEAAEADLADPAVASDGAELQRRLEAREAARTATDRLYARWEELETLRLPSDA